MTTRRGIERVRAPEATDIPIATDGFDDERVDHDVKEKQLVQESEAEKQLEQDEILSERPHVGENASENIVDRLFSKLKTTAVQDGVRLHFKTRTTVAETIAGQSKAISKPPFVEVPLTPITDRDVGISFANQLRISQDRVWPFLLLLSWLFRLTSCWAMCTGYATKTPRM